MSLIKKKKIAFYINSYSNYLDDFVSLLQTKFNIKVYLTYKNTNFTRYKLSNKKIYELISIKNYKKKLEKFNPNIIVVGGFKHFLIKYILEYKLRNNVKIFLWLERIKRNFFFKRKIYSIIYNNIFKSCDGILAIGKEALNYYKKVNKNTFLIPYNINSKNFLKNKCKKDYFNILFVGQLIERKGINLILSALKKLDNKIYKKLNITFVGEGFLKNNIISYRKKNKEIKIKLHKFLSRKQLISIYQKNNVFIFPSLYDGWGVAPMEAMASGMALIISKNCGVSEYIKHNKNGILIKPSSLDLKNAIEYYYKNPNLINYHGIKNYKFFKKSLLSSSETSKAFVSLIKKNYENSF